MNQKKIYEKVISTIQSQNNMTSNNPKTNSSRPIITNPLKLFVSGVAGKNFYISFAICCV